MLKTTVTIDKVSGAKLPITAFLNQMNEECAELIQVSSKCVRKIDEVNPTPKTWSDLEGNLIEELADVVNMIDIMLENYPEWREDVLDFAAEKRQRWIERMEVHNET